MSIIAESEYLVNMVDAEGSRVRIRRKWPADTLAEALAD